MTTATASAFPGAAIGTKCSTATSTTNGSTRTPRAMPEASSPTDRHGMVCPPPRGSHCRPTASWCLRAAREISEAAGRAPLHSLGVQKHLRLSPEAELGVQCAVIGRSRPPASLTSLRLLAGDLFLQDALVANRADVDRQDEGIDRIVRRIDHQLLRLDHRRVLLLEREPARGRD